MGRGKDESRGWARRTGTGARVVEFSLSACVDVQTYLYAGRWKILGFQQARVSLSILRFLS
jgi:hypothetical protein